MSKKEENSYLYNFYSKDDGDGSPVLIKIDGYPVQVGINVVILPGFHIAPSKDKPSSVTIIGSNSFVGKNVVIEEGSVLPERTILKGDKINHASIPFAHACLVFDDFGRTHENNAAAYEFCQRIPVHHLSLMVNRGGETDEAISLIEAGISFHQVGLHINLTEGIPLSALSQEKWYSVNQKGSLGRVLVSRRAAFFLKREEKRIILDEAKAQISKFKSIGFTPHYVDSHGNVLFQWPLAKLLTPLLINAGFSYIRIPRAEKSKHKIYNLLFKSRVKRLYKKNFKTADYFVNASDLIKADLSKYSGKNIEIMVHPYVKKGIPINRRDVDLPVLIAFLEAANIQIISSY